MMAMTLKRRSFLRDMAGAVSAACAAGYWGRVAAATEGGRSIPKRPYKNGVELSIIGMGGIVLMGQEQAAADREVARAVERGVNYFDVAPAYGKGEAEAKLGPALEPHRGKVFLACKTQKRDAAAARTELENSLRVLRTDHFDLYQMHCMAKDTDIEKAFAPGGVMEVMVKAREEGKVRFLGFSAHDEDVALKLLDMFGWDSVLFPFNYVCMTQADFGPRLLAKAKEKGVARLALKALAHTPWASKEEKAESHLKCWYRPLQDVDKVRAALRFTLSEDITAAIPPGDERVYRMAENLAAEFTPLSAEEREAVVESARGVKPIFPQQPRKAG
jgi:predicted aldo/keto reductase-like oxidoreductase